MVDIKVISCEVIERGVRPEVSSLSARIYQLIPGQDPVREIPFLRIHHPRYGMSIEPHSCHNNQKVMRLANHCNGWGSDIISQTKELQQIYCSIE